MSRRDKRLNRARTLLPLDNGGETKAELTELAIKISAEHKAATSAFKNGFEYAIKAGETLIKAKAKIPHGGWLAWLNDNCGIKERTGQYYMAIARARSSLPKSATVSDFTIREAIATISAQSQRMARLPAPIVERAIKETHDGRLKTALRQAESSQRLLVAERKREEFEKGAQAEADVPQRDVQPVQPQPNPPTAALTALQVVLQFIIVKFAAEHRSEDVSDGVCEALNVLYCWVQDGGMTTNVAELPVAASSELWFRWRELLG